MPSGTIYDYYFDLRDLRWIKWEARVPAYEPPVPMSFSKILVPTIDTFAIRTFCLRWFAFANPCYLSERSGTAKTVTISRYLESLDQSHYCSLSLNFSSRTSSIDVQRTIEDNVEKRTGTIYGPKAGKSMVVFVDDLNMPVVDKYGTQQPIALLRFLLEHGCMYDWFR